MAMRCCTGVVKSAGLGGKLAFAATQVARNKHPFRAPRKLFMMMDRTRDLDVSKEGKRFTMLKVSNVLCNYQLSSASRKS